MSNDKKKIYRDMMSDAKVRNCLMSKDKPESPDELADVLGGVALENGYQLSKDDLLALFGDRKQKTDLTVEKVERLSEADLANVAGGGNAANATCADTYKDKENCWFNDGCDYVINWYSQYLCKSDELDSIWEIKPYNP